MDAVLNTFCQGKPWKAYCISLQSCIERRQKFTTWAESIGLTFTFFDAIDKKDLTVTTLKERGIEISWGKVSPGATACRMSHEALWNYVLTREPQLEYVFILEDDAGFVRANQTILEAYIQAIQASKPDWSILQFGFGSMTGFELHLFQRRVPAGIYRADSTDQTHCLFYKRKAIEDIYALSQEEKYQKRTADGLLLAFIQRKKGHIVVPKTSIIEQTDTQSYIGAGVGTTQPSVSKIEPRTAPVTSRK